MDQLLGLGLLLLVIVLIIIISQISRKKKAAEKAVSELRVKYNQSEKMVQDCVAKIAGLEAENARLAKWRVVEDADEKAKQILAAAKAEFDNTSTQAKQLKDQATSEAAQLLASAKTEASTVTSEARQKAKELKDEATKSSHDSLLLVCGRNKQP